MPEPHQAFDEVYVGLIEKAKDIDLSSEAGSTVVKNLKTLNDARPVAPEPVPIPDPVPETRLGRFWQGTAAVLDNETTRTFIKAAGSAVGVVAVVYATIHKDHVIERNALAQANQRSS